MTLKNDFSITPCITSLILDGHWKRNKVEKCIEIINYFFIVLKYMYKISENYFCKSIKQKSHLSVFRQMHYKKIANIIATSCLVTHFYCRHNERRFVRGDCRDVASSKKLRIYKNLNM